MTELYRPQERIDLDEPVLVVALDGWIDAGFAAATARAALADQTELVTLGTFDADVLLDHRARRPTLHLDDGVATDLTWPTIELSTATTADGADLLLLHGAEPDHLWRAFSHEVVELALAYGARLVIGLGAYPAPVPHTRGTRVVATAGNRELAREIGFVSGRIEVPGGVAAAIEQAATEVGLPAAGLWAQIPHYAAAMPYPAGAVALLEALDRIADLRFSAADLAAEVVGTRERIDGLVAGNTEHELMVRRLEEQHDQAAAAATERDDDAFGAVSGDELAAELERFLREQGPD